MYSPKIKEELVRRLYIAKHRKPGAGKPMTVMVSEAVEDYLDKLNKEEMREENTEHSGADCGTDNRHLQRADQI